MDAETYAKLRAPFDAGQIDKLPRGVRKGEQKRSCRDCGGYHEPAAVHLDYVGHAQVTARLLDVDPAWTWEPFAVDDNGLPALTRNSSGQPIGLWIRLTVCDVTRLGFGELPAAKGADGVKEAIGDAIRNAAMRFGVALELWAKSDLPTPESDQPAPVDDARQAAIAEADEYLDRLVAAGDFDQPQRDTWRAYIRRHPDHPAKAIAKFVEIEAARHTATDPVQGALDEAS